MKHPLRARDGTCVLGASGRRARSVVALLTVLGLAACGVPKRLPDDAGRSVDVRSRDVADAGATLGGDVAVDVPSDTPLIPPDARPDVPAATPVDGAAVAVALTTEQRQEFDRLRTIQAEAAQVTANQLLAARSISWKTLGYDPTTAENLGLIQASALGLNAAELELFKRNGFVISDRHRYPHFGYGYQSIYAQDLPVFVSADSIMHAVHQTYRDVLKTIEKEVLFPELELLLDGMRTRLTTNMAWDSRTRADADLFLAVAKGLLVGKVAAPVAGGDAALIGKLFDAAKTATGTATIPLFGIEDRTIDMSQFTPRGHYADGDSLERYFRAMMWLGRIDFPFLRTQAEGRQVLVRQCLSAAFALRSLMDDAALARWNRIDQTIRAFVGEPDSMGPMDVDRLAQKLGIGTDQLTSVQLARVDDAKLAQAIVEGGFGKQKIRSQVVAGQQDPAQDAFPLDSTFLFFGQRYTLDSHVFSNVVHDRVPYRMLPNALDAAYAALGNDQALALLESDLSSSTRYPPALETVRRLADDHGNEFWTANLYNLWQDALRALSPTKDITDGGGLPSIARTEAWGRRILNTQLASWSQLRHNTVLYAKQSYSATVPCEFPDAYVDPYPAFFAKLEAYAHTGLRLNETLPFPAGSLTKTNLAKYFTNLGRVTGILREMAELQRQGQPHKPEHLAFINQMVKTVNVGCGGPPGLRGWYADLFWSPDEALMFDPTITDVHTAPSDEFGNPVGEVLHAGTGYARLMVTTIDTCMGPRAYAGIAFSYHEQKTREYKRLTDREWAEQFTPTSSPADVVWMRDLIAK
jgi:hypothetical protein